MTQFEKAANPGQNQLGGNLPLVAIVETPAGESLTTEEVLEYNNKLRQNRRLPSSRKKELRMKESAGLPILTEDDFTRKAPDAIAFAANLTCYSSYSQGEKRAQAANKDTLTFLRYDHSPNRIDEFEKAGGIAGPLLYKPAFWRAVEASSLVLPMVIIVSERRARFEYQSGTEVAEFAGELREVNATIAAHTDINDFGVQSNGVINARYLYSGVEANRPR